MRDKNMNEYDKQAADFMEKTGTTMEAVKLGTFPYFDDDTESRDVYYVTLKRGKNVYSFKFGDSIYNTKRREYARISPYTALTRSEEKQAKSYGVTCTSYGKITSKCLKQLKKEAKEGLRPYDVLACLTKYDPGTFNDFCSDYGYDNDSMKAFKTYQAVQEEWEGVRSLFNEEEREELAEIQ